MDRHHHLGFRRFAGRGLRHVFGWRGRWVGLDGWQSGTSGDVLGTAGPAGTRPSGSPAFT